MSSEVKTETMKVKDLRIDQKFIEMRPIQEYYVSRFRQGMRNGDQFPAIIVQEGKKNRVISGNTRLSAYLAEYGEEHEVQVITEKYKNEAEAVRRFAEENARHGVPLSGLSQKAITQELIKLGDTPENISEVLGVSVGKIMHMAGLVVAVIGGKKKDEYKPIKRGLEHLVGQKVTSEQYEEHASSDRGISYKSMVSQLIRWLRNGWIPSTDENAAIFGELVQEIETLFDGQQDKELKVA